MMIKKLCLLLIALMLMLPSAIAEEDEDWSIEENVILTDDGFEISDPDFADPEPSTKPAPVANPARQDLINRIISLGEQLYKKANGKAQRAHYSGDIYVCKNFTVYLFRQNRADFRMAAYPKTELVIPNNLPSKECKPYAYGIFWEEISAEKGNPFYVAAQFTYNKDLSYEENYELALEFMRNTQRGDYFQMSAEYYYGIGAHSAIMISDYDPVTETVHWMDSNMRGKKVDGIRYGYVQYDEVQPISWWAEAFCKKTRGATLYRLRDDIVYVSEVNK